MFSTGFEYAEPMMPNCSSHSGRQSTFAPESSKTIGPFDRRPNRCDGGPRNPSIVRSRMSAIARKAPLFPADTAASAFPAFTMLTAMPSDVVPAMRAPPRRADPSERPRAHAESQSCAAASPCRSGRMRASSPTRIRSPYSSCREQRAGDDLLGRVVAAHCVDRNAGLTHRATIQYSAFFMTAEVVFDIRPRKLPPAVFDEPLRVAFLLRAAVIQGDKASRCRSHSLQGRPGRCADSGAGVQRSRMRCRGLAARQRVVPPTVASFPA